jgi:ATP-dependent helicase/nuclease subunit B
MLPSRLLIRSSSMFWTEVARTLFDARQVTNARDLSGIRVVVPNFAHAQLLRAALRSQLRHTFMPPRITTLSAWLAMLPPDAAEVPVASHGERMMSLYAELRQHGWLKKLFSARRNTDLLPLAQVLLTLFDELSEALLPSMRVSPDAAEERWQAALAQLPLPARNLLSDEAQLVWSLWKSQLGNSDPAAACFARLMQLAESADAPLVWVSPVTPTGMHEAFLEAYAARKPTCRVTLDWHADAVAGVYASTWPEIVDDSSRDLFAAEAQELMAPVGISLHAARNLEEEAQHGAQTIIDWLQRGRTSVAIIAQDRVTARRIRALLERAQVMVCDETGWKLSTTRSAAAIAALLDVVATRAETVALLDLLKSPYFCAHVEDKDLRVMEIEHALRKANVLGGWEAARRALAGLPAAQQLLAHIAEQVARLAGRKRLTDWGGVTGEVLDALGMRKALEKDGAGQQVITLLDMLAHDCAAMSHPFSFHEWRAFLGLQLESTPFVPVVSDRRVVMLQLNGAQLRSFDAVLMVGADAAHLPSETTETLFFANAVRRELGLATREMHQRMQLRDFAELLSTHAEVVLSWQSYRNGEPSSVSGWIERLQLTLERAGLPALPRHEVKLASHTLTTMLPGMPSPAAPQLLPRKLSASGYNSLVACPYQFFATRMLDLFTLEELSDMPEKRDYGDWLHAILKTYHDTVRDERTQVSARETLLREITDCIFGKSLEQSAAALGYYARWLKAMPAYLAWANERENQGWHFVIGEQRYDKLLSWPGGQITLHGVIDRIDENQDGERAVHDYKARPVQPLRDKLKGMEDHQLAFYGLLSDAPATSAHFVALEVTKDKTGDAEAKNYVEWQRQLESRIIDDVSAIAQGAELRATGIEPVCAYCEVRGLCRKGAW